ncbi:SusC/RagA family TonB-linked outer membrane protein [Sphingobacterium sp. UDSM-2020]|uniref:SusC/RagA family TonB-linked outer membrane protein n=1 Tax=Sphingobacterium sp. UDSM-2020 TaxID=2795738 RepID=UPI001934F8B1|nr:SusC/RagA family TonB-linked outer membrane protein [Sphingobacterium sp. UDSM-2020]QQD15824.1 SusC/RagA family TonB-linked outer membrane protein [Sphingobacterium sp. UDSM-2020]
MKYILHLLILFLAPDTVLGQVITGLVTDSQKKPLRAVSVSLTGANMITSTDSRGQFSIVINGIIDDPKLRFSAIGFQPRVLRVDGRSNLSVVLTTSTSVLDEVQVIAYGTTSQRFNVGSVTKVKAEDIARQPISNPLEALQGRVAGLVVNATSGLPGSSFKIQVRGQNTLPKATAAFGTPAPMDNPLIVIDGIPFAPQNENINQFGSLASPGNIALLNNQLGGFSPLNSLNPSDIESIEVLKDADATAIYGSRGGNGVILITTKKGAGGRTQFDMDVRQGISYMGETMRMMNTTEYLTMRREAIINDGLSPNLTLWDRAFAPDLLAFDPARYTDWKDYFLGKSASNTAFTGALSGGSQNTNFRLGIGLNKTSYIFPGDYADKRASLSSNLHHNSENKKFSIDLATTYSYGKNNSAGNSNVLTAYRLDPNFPDLTDADGNLEWDYNGIQFGMGILDNPISYLRNTYQMKNTLLNSNLLLAYKLTDELTMRSSFGYNAFNGDEYSGNPFLAQNPYLSPEATSSFGKNSYVTLIAEPQLQFKKTAGRNAFEVLLGGSYQYNTNEREQITGRGYTHDGLITSINGARNRYATDAYSEYKYVGAFGRFNYKYRNRYIANLSVRRDGSSRFGPGKRFGNFGSIGFGWIFSEEDFVKNRLGFLSYGKIRASYGIAGSDATGDYQYISRWGTSSYPYEGVVGLQPINLFNPELSWASTKKFEVGLELGFIDDMLFFSSSYYRNRSNNQLLSYYLPSQTGFSSVAENWDATVQNSGIEITVQSKNIARGSFSWNTSFNISLPKNKLLSFEGLETSSYATRYMVGKPLNAIYAFQYNGVNPETGLFEFRNIKGELTSNPQRPSGTSFNDFAYIGSSDPVCFGGIQNTVTYKNFQLDLFVEFRKQTGSNYLKQVYNGAVGQEYNLPASMLDRWQQPGDRVEFQRYTTTFGGDVFRAGQNYAISDAVYSDASYIRFKTLNVSYALDKKIADALRVKAMRLYGSAQNLFTITNYLGNDPETQGLYTVPVLKTFVIGLQLSL